MIVDGAGEQFKEPREVGHKRWKRAEGFCEKVEKAAGGDGKWHRVDRQSKTMSCGPTCVKMVAEYTINKRVGESYFRNLVDNEARDMGGLAAGAVRDYNADQSGGKQLLNALITLGVKHSRWVKGMGPAEKLEHYKKSSTDYPAIFRVKWQKVGYHFIVVCGPLETNADRFLVLDPAWGLQHLNAEDPDCYEPRHAGEAAGKKLAKGTISHFAILTYPS